MWFCSWVQQATSHDFLKVQNCTTTSDDSHPEVPVVPKLLKPTLDDLLRLGVRRWLVADGVWSFFGGMGRGPRFLPSIMFFFFLSGMVLFLNSWMWPTRILLKKKLYTVDDCIWYVPILWAENAPWSLANQCCAWLIIRKNIELQPCILDGMMKRLGVYEDCVSGSGGQSGDVLLESRSRDSFCHQVQGTWRPETKWGCGMTLSGSVWWSSSCQWHQCEACPTVHERRVQSWPWWTRLQSFVWEKPPTSLTSRVSNLNSWKDVFNANLHPNTRCSGSTWDSFEAHKWDEFRNS